MRKWQHHSVVSQSSSICSSHPVESTLEYRNPRSSLQVPVSLPISPIFSFSPLLRPRHCCTTTPTPPTMAGTNSTNSNYRLGIYINSLTLCHPTIALLCPRLAPFPDSTKSSPHLTLTLTLTMQRCLDCLDCHFHSRPVRRILPLYTNDPPE